MTVAGVSFSVMALTVGHLSGMLSEENLLFYRSIGHVILLLPILIFKNENPFRSLTLLVLFRSLLGFLGIACFFISLHGLAPGLSTLLQWTAPAFTFVFAILFLGEKVSKGSGLKLMGVALGLGIVLGPKAVAAKEAFDYFHLIVGFLGAALAGGSYCLLKKIGTSASEESLGFWLSACGVILVYGIQHNKITLPPANEIGGLVLISVCVALYQFAVTRAYREAKATVIAPLSLLPVVLTITFEACLARRLPDVASIFGAGLMVASLTLIQLRRPILRGPSEALEVSHIDRYSEQVQNT